MRDLQAKVEEERRRVESERTLFEGLVSKKGKDVQVVGVERKKRKPMNKVAIDAKGKGRAMSLEEQQGKGQGSDEENRPTSCDTRIPIEAVFYTQGGSAHSQATMTQVQRELNDKIKINKKVSKGDFLAVVQQGKGKGRDQGSNAVLGKSKDNNEGEGGGVAAASAVSKVNNDSLAKIALAANGVGSKKWKSAMDLLASRDEAAKSAAKGKMKEVVRDGEPDTLGHESEGGLGGSESGSGSDGKPQRRKVGNLENYADSRFRLSERARKLYEARGVAASAVPSNSSSLNPPTIPTSNPTSKSTDIDTNMIDITAPSYEFPRPFRNTERKGTSLIDQAASNAKGLEYNPWMLAGSEVDLVKDRCVVSFYLLSILLPAAFSSVPASEG